MKIAPTLLLCLFTASSAFAATPAAPVPVPAPVPPPVDRADVERELEAARERLEAAASQVAELSSQLGGRYAEAFRERGFGRPRAMLGIQIEGRRGDPGVKVAAVSPGGAAEAAGIKAGDVIVAIDGLDLRKADEPARSLTRHLRDLEPDGKVKITVERDGQAREIMATPRPVPRDGRGFGPGPGPQGPPPPPGGLRGPVGPQGGPAGPGGRFGFYRMLARDLEMADLSPRLAGYFGAKSGVLVVRAGRDGLLKLEDGDVITAIDGREPSSASHAMRILRSYQPGEKLQIRLLRDRKPLTLDATLSR